MPLDIEVSCKRKSYKCLVGCSIRKGRLEKGFSTTKTIPNRTNKLQDPQMSEKLDKHKIEELKQMVKDKNADQPVEEVLAIFCARHGLKMGTCRYYYNVLADKGEIGEK
jgi:hypothetical protein